jgi:DNA repair protein RadC
MKTYKSQIPELTLKRTPSEIEKIKISSSKDSADYARKFYSDDISIYESFFLILMNRANNTIGWVKISQGGITGTVADIKIIAKYVVESLASSVILCHNHPSGNINPSDADKALTKRCKEALQLVDTIVLDHIIISEEGHFSFADEGLL